MVPSIQLMKPSYLDHLKQTTTVLKTVDGRDVPVWELLVTDDEGVFKEWAIRFRNHYCLDAEIDAFRAGTGLSRRDYLLTLVFPDGSAKPGPSIRSGDFAEFLVADYVEFFLGFWVPRNKYAHKESRNESAKGVDILGFKFVKDGETNPADSLISFEVKAQLSGSACTRRLQDAIDDSAKDFVRAGASLNATKQRLVRAGAQAQAALVGRFQNLADNSYVFRNGAAAVVSGKSYDETSIAGCTAANHTNGANLELIVVRGESLMDLANALYGRAADEA